MAAAASTGPMGFLTTARNRAAARQLHVDGRASAGSPLLDEIADRLPDVLLDAGLQLAPVQRLWRIRALALCKGLGLSTRQSALHMEKHTITPTRTPGTSTGKHYASSQKQPVEGTVDHEVWVNQNQQENSGRAARM